MGIVMLLFFLCRCILILRLKKLDKLKYIELGKPNYSDVYMTKAGRALLVYLIRGKFRDHKDKILALSAWLTISFLALGNAGMVLVLIFQAYC